MEFSTIFTWIKSKHWRCIALKWVRLQYNLVMWNRIQWVDAHMLALELYKFYFHKWIEIIQVTWNNFECLWYLGILYVHETFIPYTVPFIYNVQSLTKVHHACTHTTENNTSLFTTQCYISIIQYCYSLYMWSLYIFISFMVPPRNNKEQYW